MKLKIERVRVKLPTEQDKDANKVPPPSYSSFFRFSYRCTYCHQLHDLYQPQKAVYSENDLLKMAQSSFEFASRKCDHGKKKSEKVPT